MTEKKGGEGGLQEPSIGSLQLHSHLESYFNIVMEYNGIRCNTCSVLKVMFSISPQ